MPSSLAGKSAEQSCRKKWRSQALERNLFPRAGKDLIAGSQLGGVICKSLCYSSWKLASAPYLAPVGAGCVRPPQGRASRTPLSTQFSLHPGTGTGLEGNKKSL